MKLNENIRNFRTFRRISQQQLADLLGKSKSVISNWERGENSPDLESIEKMCKILKITPNQLFGWEKNPEYEAFVKDVEEYQLQIDALRSEIQHLESEISLIEQLKADRSFFDWDSEDDNDNNNC